MAVVTSLARGCALGPAGLTRTPNPGGFVSQRKRCFPLGTRSSIVLFVRLRFAILDPECAYMCKHANSAVRQFLITRANLKL